MYRRCLIVTLNSLARAARPQISLKNNINPKDVFRDVKICRSFATTSVPEYSTENLPKVAYKDVKRWTNDKNIVIIDVREPQELIDHGILPGSINIPCEVEEALRNMSDDQFLKKYGHSKPEEKTPIVFSCMKGIRSEKAQIKALKIGYKDVRNYLGGWNDWAEKTKK